MSRYFSKLFPLLSVSFALLLAGCAMTQVNAVWKDPSYQSRPARIMVIGVAKNPLNRRLFEDEFVKQLKARGTDAIASYTVLSDKLQDDKDAIAAKVRELGADTILITRMVSRKTVKVYVPGTPYYPPPYYGMWPDYYGYGYQYLYTPGYVTDDQYAVIETNLYAADSDKLLWAASAETGITDDKPGMMQEFIGVIVGNMIDQGLLAK